MEFRQTQRWAHWAFGLGAAALGLGFGYMNLRMLQGSTEFGQGGMIFFFPYLLGCYWLLATVVNMRTVVLSPHGLTLKVWPIPVRNGLRFERAGIRCCYAQYVTLVDEDGVAGPSFYMAGVESRSGFQINLLGPFQTYETAMASAGELANIMNSGGKAPYIPVELREHLPQAPGHKRRVLLWAAAFIAAILLGAWWEISRIPGGVRYTGPRFW